MYQRKFSLLENAKCKMQNATSLLQLNFKNLICLVLMLGLNTALFSQGCSTLPCSQFKLEIVRDGDINPNPVPEFCSGPSNCTQTQYVVRLKSLNNLLQNFTLRYKYLNAKVRLDVNNFQSPFGTALSHIDVATTNACNQNAWFIQPTVNGNFVEAIFSQDDETACPYQVDNLVFTQGACKLFTVVVNTYPGESINVTCADFKYLGTAAGIECNGILNPSYCLAPNAYSVPNPGVGTINEILRLEYEASGTSSAYPCPVNIVLKNTSSTQPIFFRELQFVCRISKPAGEVIFSSVNMSYTTQQQSNGTDTERFYHLLMKTINPNGILLGPNNQVSIGEFTFPGSGNLSLKSDFNLSFMPSARVNSAFECSRLNVDPGDLKLTCGQYEDCAPNDFMVNIAGNAESYACDSKYAIEVSLNQPAQLYRLGVRLKMNTTGGNLSISDVNLDDWFPCPNPNTLSCNGQNDCVFNLPNVADYCFEVLPSNAIGITPSNKIRIFISYAGNGIVSMPDIERLELGIIDPVTQQPRLICVPTYTMSGFPMSPVNLSISGRIATENNDAIEGAIVLCSSGNNCENTDFNIVPPLPTDATYKACYCPQYSSYTITPSHDIDYLNGVSTFDLVLISKHILGIEPLTSPYKIIAADANRSGSVTTFDITEIRKLILGIYDDLPNNTSWRFVDKSYTFPIPLNPFEPAFPENITLSTNGMSNYNGRDFVGLKVGDVNNSAIANKPAMLGKAPFHWTSGQRQTGDYLTLPVIYTGREKLEALQFGLRFDPTKLEYIGVTSGDTKDWLPVNFGLQRVKDGEIRTLWIPDYNSEEKPQAIAPGMALFYLTFKVLEDAGSGDLPLYFDDTVLENAVWDIGGQQYRPEYESATEDSRLSEKRETSVISKLSISLDPNPVKDMTKLVVGSEVTGKFHWALFDANGVRQKYLSLPLTAGQGQELSIDLSQLPSGVYVWKSRMGRTEQEGRLIKL